MRNYLFHKANYFLGKNQVLVVPDSETAHSIRLVCGDHEVMFSVRNHLFQYSCNCKANSNGMLCSHVVASMGLLAMRPNLIKGEKNE